MEASWELTEEDEARGAQQSEILMNPVAHLEGLRSSWREGTWSRGADEAKKQQKTSDKRTRFWFALLELISNNYWIISQ